MTDLDRDLAARLDRLAAAVPVGPGHLDPVHAVAVAARRRVRMSWVTPLVALLLLGLLALLIGAGGAQILNGPVSVTTRQGDFELTLRSAKGQYVAGEPIDLVATLTYIGADQRIRIGHGLGSPMAFGIVEPVNGIHLEPASRLVCESSQLDRGVGVSRDFSKSGGSDGSIPGFQAFMETPGLALPAGTWHPYVLAEFSIGDCGQQPVSVRAELEIRVTGIDPSPTASRNSQEIEPPSPTPPAAVSGTPTPTLDASPTPHPSPNPMQISKDIDGDFEFVLTSDKTVYRPGEPIRIEAALTYLGSDASIPIETDSLLIGFHLHEKVFGKIDLGPLSLLMCSTTILTPDTPLVMAFPKVGGYHAGSLTASELAWLNDPVLTLPVGTWHFSAGTASPCWTPMSTKFSVGAEVTIVVRDEG